MSRPAVVLLVLAAVAASATPTPAAAAANARGGCRTLAPTDVRLALDRDGARGVVRWRVPSGHPAGLAFRVARDGAVVGQTRARRMRLALAPARATTITVTTVLRGRPTRCAATVRVRGRGTAPAAVQGLSTTPRRGGRLTLSWEPAAPGDHPIRGYRLRRDGRTVATLAGRSITIAVPARGSRRLQVAAVDRAGHVGRPSPAVTVQAGHLPPTAPLAPAASELSGTTAVLSWGRARAIGAHVRGYRLLRDGRTVLAVAGTRARLTRAPGHTYRVVAVDSLGWTSRPSAPVTIATARAAPRPTGTTEALGAPGAPRATAVTDTAVALAWAPSAVPAGSQLRGYRLMRDGEVVTQVAALSANVGNLAAKSAHDWTVAAVDTRGRASAPSPATRVVQADPPAATGGVHAFLLASTDSSFAAFRKHYRQIGVVYPTYYECDTANGRILGADDRLITGFAQDRGVKVLPRFNCQRTAVVHQILTDPALRSQWLDTMTALAEQGGWDGVSLDFESVPPTDRDALTAFVADLSDRLHAAGKLLSQAVSAKLRDIPDHPRSGAFDYPALAQYDDHVFVMAWGIHWSTSLPGAQDDFAWVRQIRDYVATMPQRPKFVMGTMLYGMDWPAGGGPSHPGEGLHYGEIEALAARYGAVPAFDAGRRAWYLAYTDEAGVPHDVWYPDAGAVGDRVALAREQGLGVGFWRIGQEDERIWSDPRLTSPSVTP